MSVSLQNGARGLKILPCLKYYNVLKQENRLTLGLNTAKNTGFMKTILEVKVVENSISYKKVSRRMYLFPPGVELGGLKDSKV